MFSEKLHALVERLDGCCRAQNGLLATAESCTGGLLSTLITERPGVSEWFYGSAVTYSNDAKKNLLNVSSVQLVQHGAVSQAVAEAMVLGIFENTVANIAVSITGVAGPDGGTKEKPVGAVWFAWGMRDSEIFVEKNCFQGNRSEIRIQAAEFALTRLIGLLDD